MSNIYDNHCALVEKLYQRVNSALEMSVKVPVSAGIVKDTVNAYAVALDKLATFHADNSAESLRDKLT